MMDFDLDRFPVRSSTRDGTPYSIRALTESDEQQFRDFHTVIPEREQLFIRNQIRDGSLFRDWMEDSSFETVLPLGAFVDGQLVSIGVLKQRPGGWKRHIGVVYLLTHPEYRGLGIIDQLLEQVITSATNSGLRRLESELNGDRVTAIEALGKAGFEELLRLSGYVQDMASEYHDYVLMGMNLIPSLEHISAGD